MNDNFLKKVRHPIEIFCPDFKAGWCSTTKILFSSFSFLKLVRTVFRVPLLQPRRRSRRALEFLRKKKKKPITYNVLYQTILHEWHKYSEFKKKLNIVKNKVLCNKFIFHKSKYGVSCVFTHTKVFCFIFKCALTSGLWVDATVVVRDDTCVSCPGNEVEGRVWFQYRFFSLSHVVLSHERWRRRLSHWKRGALCF